MADITTDQQFLAQDPEVLGLQRQRKLADLLTGQAFNQPQGQMISGHFVKPSALQQALPMINAAIGGFTNANLDNKQQELAAALRFKGDAAVKDIMSTYKQDPQAALTMATQLQQYPQVKAILPQLSKVGINESPTSKQEFDNAKADGFPGNYAQFLEWSANLKAPRTSVYNNMPPAESEYAKTFGAGVAKQDLALKDIAEAAPGVIANVTRQRELLKSNNVITGFGADQRLALAQFGKAIGATGEGNDLVSNTQSLLAGRAGATLDAIKTSNLGSAQGFSNTDREFLERAKLGGIKYDKKSLEKQLELEEKVARVGAERWNTRLKEMPKSASMPINTSPVKLSNDDPLGIR